MTIVQRSNPLRGRGRASWFARREGMVRPIPRRPSRSSREKWPTGCQRGIAQFNEDWLLSRIDRWVGVGISRRLLASATPGVECSEFDNRAIAGATRILTNRGKLVRIY